MINVELIKWKYSDRETLKNIVNLINRDFLSNCIPCPYTLENADWWLNMVEKHEGKNGVFRAITVNGKKIGTISVEQKSDVHCKDAEIGYYLLTEAWSKGIMTEAVRQICEIAFHDLDIIRITGLVYDSNIASRKVLEKNEFILEGVMKNAVFKNETIADLCIYGKFK